MKSTEKILAGVILMLIFVNGLRADPPVSGNAGTQSPAITAPSFTASSVSGTTTVTGTSVQTSAVSGTDGAVVWVLTGGSNTVLNGSLQAQSGNFDVEQNGAVSSGGNQLDFGNGDMAIGGNIYFNSRFDDATPPFIYQDGIGLGLSGSFYATSNISTSGSFIGSGAGLTGTAAGLHSGLDLALTGTLPGAQVSGTVSNSASAAITNSSGSFQYSKRLMVFVGDSITAYGAGSYSYDYYLLSNTNGNVFALCSGSNMGVSGMCLVGSGTNNGLIPMYNYGLSGFPAIHSLSPAVTGSAAGISVEIGANDFFQNGLQNNGLPPFNLSTYVYGTGTISSPSANSEYGFYNQLYADGWNPIIVNTVTPRGDWIAFDAFRQQLNLSIENYQQPTGKPPLIIFDRAALLPDCNQTSTNHALIPLYNNDTIHPTAQANWLWAQSLNNQVKTGSVTRAVQPLGGTIYTAPGGLQVLSSSNVVMQSLSVPYGSSYYATHSYYFNPTFLADTTGASTLTNTGSVTPAAAFTGSSALFTGANYLTASQPFTKNGHSWYCSTWFYCTSTSGAGTMCGDEAGGTSGAKLEVVNGVVYGVWDTSTGNYNSAGLSISASTWYNVVWGWNNNTSSAFLMSNGVTSQVSVLSGTMVGATSNWVFGAAVGGSNKFNGYVGPTVFCDGTVPSQNEELYLYNGGTPLQSLNPSGATLWGTFNGNVPSPTFSGTVGGSAAVTGTTFTGLLVRAPFTLTSGTTVVNNASISGSNCWAQEYGTGTLGGTVKVSISGTTATLTSTLGITDTDSGILFVVP